MKCVAVTPLSLVIIASALAKATDDTTEKDYRDVPLDKIGVSFIKPAKDAKTGFMVGGKNATALIRKLTEINGRKIADLEKDMRPGAIGGPRGKNGEPFE